MTYEEQLKIEQLNKEIINNIINTVIPEDFINFYLYHNQKETMTKYGLRTTKQLTKILTIFNYDFSKPKPSKFKGKKAARSHESYIASGQKSSRTQKENWQNKSLEEKIAWSEKQVIAHSTDEFKQKIKQINLNYREKLTQEQKEAVRQKRSISNKKTWDLAKTEILEKAYQTKKENKSFNTSSVEDNYYIFLCNNFGKNDIVRQYKDSRYPFACDFYIKSKDLFIELNISWTHGGHLFNSTDEADIAKLALWQERAKTSDYYKKAIQVWTELDVKKDKIAKANNLNYIRYYTEADLYD